MDLSTTVDEEEENAATGTTITSWSDIGKLVMIGAVFGTETVISFVAMATLDVLMRDPTDARARATTDRIIFALSW